MTQEEKDLLLKDICARLPYGVIVRLRHQRGEEVWYSDWDLTYGYTCDTESIVEFLQSEESDNIIEYLRPMSSMTEKEAVEFETLSDKLLMEADNTKIWNSVVDWLNEHHFDHRGLIEKGLALEAPYNMYNLNEK